MNKLSSLNYFLLFFLFLFSLSFFSCVSVEPTVADIFDGNTSSDSNISIMGKGKASAKKLGDFFISQNPTGKTDKAYRLASYYIEESKIEGVNSDVAFIQMCLETGYLRFGGLVSESMNNFCGLGAIDASNKGCSFKNEREGVKAHIQHLKAYGSSKPLNAECVDPRYKYVNPKGKAPTVDLLSGTWASDKKYGTKIINLIKKLLE